MCDTEEPNEEFELRANTDTKAHQSLKPAKPPYPKNKAKSYQEDDEDED